MAFKKLQKGFTTPEQSKRLLELGVPADSADCVWYNPYCDGDIPELADIYVWKGKYPQRVDKYTSPCWSAGRLMEICDICILAGGGKKGEFSFDRNGLNKTYVQDMVDTIEGMLKLKLIDFSKLADYR